MPDTDPRAAVRAEAAKDSTSIDSSRRRFLFALGAGGASAAAAATTAGAATAGIAPEPIAADDAQYRVTEHVRDYYRSTKI